MVRSIPSFAGRHVKDLVAVLDNIHALNPSTAKAQVKQTCNVRSVKAYDLYLLGVHLRRYDDLNYRDISDKLEACALANDGQSLAFRIVRDAIFTGRLQEPQMIYPLKIVKDYADQGFPKAVSIWGQLMESQAKYSEALQFYQKWTEIYAEARQSPPFSQNMDTAELANINKAFAELLVRSGYRARAEVAIREAVQIYDDPTACYFLAIEFIKPSSPEFETYLLKAAASGNPKAACELGVLYLKRSRGGSQRIVPSLTQTSPNHQKRISESKNSVSPPSPQLSLEMKRKNEAAAKEWLTVAATSGIATSQIYLGILLHSEGHADEGLEWLQAASRSKDNAEWAETINYLKRVWRLPDSPDLMQVDIDALRKSPGKSSSKSGAGLASLIETPSSFGSYQRNSPSE